MPYNFVKRTASFKLTQKASIIIFHFSFLILLITDRSVNLIPLYYSNESVIIIYVRVTWIKTFPDFRYLLSKSTTTMYCTSIYISFEIISVRVWDEILRSCFLGAVVQFTHSLGNDIIKALTSDVAVARL